MMRTLLPNDFSPKHCTSEDQFSLNLNIPLGIVGLQKQQQWSVNTGDSTLFASFLPGVIN